MNEKTLLVISPEWPGDQDGYQIALRSTLFHFMNQYDHVEYLVISEKPQPEMAFSTENCRFTHIPIRFDGLAARFLKSLFSGVPAVCIRFCNRSLNKSVGDFLSKKLSDADFDVVYEDVPATALYPVVSSSSRARRHVLRSHNVLSEAFLKFTRQGKIHSRMAWLLETKRIRRFEEQALKKNDAVFAITENDKEIYESKFPGIHIDYQDVSFSREFFDNCFVMDELVDPKKIISIGCYDLRKAHGMNWFVEECFKPVRDETNQSIELILGGKHTQGFNNPKFGVSGLGFVESEQSFMKQGNIFVNPQLVGSGVKLKSLVAMAYGKCLLTTPIGIEGIAGRHGEHFLIGETAEETKVLLREIVSGNIDLLQIGRNARRLIEDQYLDESVENRMFKFES